MLGFAQSKNWNEVKNDPRLAETLATLDGYLAEMKNVQNDFKQTIRDAIAELRTKRDGKGKKGLEDKTGRVNPTAAATQIEALIRQFTAEDSFTERAIEITGISGYLSQDSNILFSKLKQNKDFYTEFTKFIEDHCSKSLKFIGPQDTKELHDAVDTFESKIDRKQLAPFASFAALIKTYFSSAKKEIGAVEKKFEEQRESNEAQGRTTSTLKAVRTVRPAADLPAHDETHEGSHKKHSDGANMLALPRQHLVGAYVAAKAQQITGKLSEACEEAVLIKEYTGHYNFENLLKCIEEASALASERKVADEYYPREFNPLWVRFKSMIAQCRAAAHSAKDTNDVKSRNTQLENLKENIKAFIAHDVIPFVTNLTAFRAAASTDDEGNLYIDLVSFDVEHTGQHTIIPPVLRPQSGRPLTRREVEAKEATLGDEPHIIQVGAVKQRFVLDRSTCEIVATPNDKRTLSFNSKPPCEILPAAQQIHGIIIADLENERPMSSRITEIADFLEGTHDVIGHNIRTDMACLLAEAARAGGKPAETKLKNLKPLPERFPRNLYDTAQAGQAECRIISPETGLYKFPRLGQLYETLFDGEKIENAHDALADARATMRCFIELVMRNAAVLGEPQYRIG